MSIDNLINVVVAVTLFEMMAAIGLGVTFADLAAVLGNGRLLLRAALANYLCVPAAAVGLLMLYRPEGMIAAGFLIAAVCPGAPYAPPFTAIAKGNVAVSVGLMVVLAASSALLAPLLLYFLLPLVVKNDSLSVDAGRMIATLLVTQLLPLFIGLTIRGQRPNLAARLLKPARIVSTVLNLSMIGLIVAVRFGTLTAIRPQGFVGMLALVLAALAAGWLLGTRGGGNRRAMAITTSVRNVGVSLVIATSSFPGTPTVTAALAFGVFQTIVLALLAAAWGGLVPTKPNVVGLAASSDSRLP